MSASCRRPGQAVLSGSPPVIRRDCGDRGRMRIYSFSLVNHLGERFGTRTAACADDAAALAHGRSFEADGYPVEIHIEGRRLSLSTTPAWSAEPWLRHLL